MDFIASVDPTIALRMGRLVNGIALQERTTAVPTRESTNEKEGVSQLLVTPHNASTFTSNPPSTLPPTDRRFSTSSSCTVDPFLSSLLTPRTTRSGRCFSDKEPSPLSSLPLPLPPPSRRNTQKRQLSEDQKKHLLNRDPVTGEFTKSKNPVGRPRKRRRTSTGGQGEKSKAPETPFTIPWLSYAAEEDFTRTMVNGEKNQDGKESEKKEKKRKRPREDAQHVGDEVWIGWKATVVGEFEVGSYEAIKQMVGAGALRKWGWLKGTEETGEKGKESRVVDEGEPTGQVTRVEKENVAEDVESLNDAGEEIEPASNPKRQQLELVPPFVTSDDATVESPNSPQASRNVSGLVGEAIPTESAVTSVAPTRSRRRRNVPGELRKRDLVALELGARSSTRLAIRQSLDAGFKADREEGEVDKKEAACRNKEDGGEGARGRRRGKRRSSSMTSTVAALPSPVDPIPSGSNVPKSPPVLPSDSPLLLPAILSTSSLSLAPVSLPTVEYIDSPERQDQDERTEVENDVLAALLSLKGGQPVDNIDKETRLDGEGGISEEGHIFTTDSHFVGEPYQLPSPVSPLDIFHPSSRRALSIKDSNVPRSAGSSTSALANKPQLSSRARLPPPTLVKIAPKDTPQHRPRIVSVKQQQEKRKRERMGKNVETMRAQLWGDLENGAKEELDPVYDATFLGAKLNVLQGTDARGSYSSVARSLATSPMLILLSPSLGRPLLSRLPRLGLSPLLPALSPSNNRGSLLPRSDLSLPLRPTKFVSTLEYLYGRKIDPNEVDWLESTEPVFYEFVETMSLVREVNEDYEL